MKSAILLALFLSSTFVQFASADEPTELEISDNSEMTKVLLGRIGHLIDRIDQLEKRIAEIESRPAPKRASSGVKPSESPLLGWSKNPNKFAPQLPAPPDAPIPSRFTTPPSVGSPTPSKQNIPDSWQRLHVNGQWFYIIPIEQVPLPKSHVDL